MFSKFDTFIFFCQAGSVHIFIRLSDLALCYLSNLFDFGREQNTFAN